MIQAHLHDCKAALQEQVLSHLDLSRVNPAKDLCGAHPAGHSGEARVQEAHDPALLGTPGRHCRKITTISQDSV